MDEKIFSFMLNSQKEKAVSMLSLTHDYVRFDTVYNLFIRAQRPCLNSTCGLSNGIQQFTRHVLKVPLPRVKIQFQRKQFSCKSPLLILIYCF